MDTFTLVSLIIIVISMLWSIGMLIYAGVRKHIERKKSLKDVYKDDEQ